jgi:thiol-disulfide isomerase/thioredoxin
MRVSFSAPSRVVPLVAAAALILTGCAGGAPSAEGGFVGGDGSLTIVPVADRKAAPRITGELLGGGTFDSDAIQGKVIVYNVWGSWCAPCRKEAPALEAAARDTAGVAQFVGINTRDLDQAPALAFSRAFDITYPSVFDPDGRELLKFGSQLPPSAIPSTLVVDTEGRIAARVLGEVTEGTVTGLIDDVAAGK